MKYFITSIVALLIGATLITPAQAQGFGAFAFSVNAPATDSLLLAELQAEQLAAQSDAAALAGVGQTQFVFFRSRFGIGLRNRIFLNRVRRAQFRAAFGVNPFVNPFFFNRQVLRNRLLFGF